MTICPIDYMHSHCKYAERQDRANIIFDFMLNYITSRKDLDIMLKLTHLNVILL